MQTPRKLIIFLGPPGSGKGTQGMRLSNALEMPLISTGELLRRESLTGTEMGRRIDATLRSGQLLADGEMNCVVANRLAAPDCQLGCVLDGFPRTLKQAQFLDGWLARTGGADITVFDFVVSVKELIERLGKRRHCPSCGTIFSTRHSARPDCPNDGSLLVARADDQPQAIRERLQIYQRNAGPLTTYYRGANYHRVAGERSPDSLTRELLSIVQTRMAEFPITVFPVAAHA